MSLRDRIHTLEDQVDGIFVALAFALTLAEPERTRRLQLVIRALHIARLELRAVRDEDRRRPRLGAVAPATAGATVGGMLTWVSNRKSATVAAVVGTAAVAALAVGMMQLPGTPDGGQARPAATSPTPSATLPPGPVPEGGAPTKRRPTSTRTHPGPSTPEAWTDPRTQTTTGSHPGGAPPAPGQPGPAITDDPTAPSGSSDPSTPGGPSTTGPPSTPPPATSSPPDPTDPPRPDPGGLLCLDVDVPRLIDLDLCLL